MVGQGLWSQKSFSQSLDDIYASGQSASLESSSGLVSTGKSWLCWLLSSPWRSKAKQRLIDNTHAESDFSKAAAESSLHSEAERQAALLQLWDSWTLYGATWLARVGDVARRFARFWVRCNANILELFKIHMFVGL